MQSDPEKELFSKLSQIKDFTKEVFHNDSLDDWNPAKDLGDFLIRIDPEGIFGYALIARACRHLGDRPRATEALERCRAIFKSGGLTPMELEVFRPFLMQEVAVDPGLSE